MLKISYLLVTALLLISFTACNSDNSSNKDSDTQPDLSCPPPDADNGTDKDSITEHDSNETDSSNDDSETTDSNLDCPDIKTVDFPFYDKDGKITFCRECDTPTEKDPQCMKNLWHEYQKSYLQTHQGKICEEFPCEIEVGQYNYEQMEEEQPPINGFPGMVESVGMHDKCDIYIHKGWSIGAASSGKRWNVSNGKLLTPLTEGKIGTKPELPSLTMRFVHDLKTNKYMAVTPTFSVAGGAAYNHFLHLTADFNTREKFLEKKYLTYTGSDGRQAVVFNKPVHTMPYESAVSEKWVLAVVQDLETMEISSIYAKIGEWKWTTLIKGGGYTGILFYPNIVGDRLAATDNSGQFGYICDLDKSPQSLQDCFKINRLIGGEQESLAFNPQLDKQNPERAVYFSSSSEGRKIVMVEKKNEKWEYKDIVSFGDRVPEKYHYTMSATYFDGDLFSYKEHYRFSEEPYSLACFYRLDKNKSYCMNQQSTDKLAPDGTVKYRYGSIEFDKENEVAVWQTQSATSVVKRDMKCYCQEEGVCPFEE